MHPNTQANNVFLFYDGSEASPLFWATLSSPLLFMVLSFCLFCFLSPLLNFSDGLDEMVALCAKLPEGQMKYAFTYLEFRLWCANVNNVNICLILGVRAILFPPKSLLIYSNCTIEHVSWGTCFFLNCVIDIFCQTNCVNHKSITNIAIIN